MKKIKIIICTAIFITASSVAQEKFNLDGFADKADKYMKALVHVGEFSGTVLVANKGEIIFEEGYDFASKRFNIPNSSDTKYRIGSMTKSFTAICILQLVEQGKLSLKDPVSNFIKDYPFGELIKIKNLLSHTSGIKRDLKFDDASKKYDLDELINMSKVDSLLYKPGTRMTYSNCGYVLLHKILEIVSNEPYESYVVQNVLKPLGLENTGIEDPLFPPVGLADGFGKGMDRNGNFGVKEIHMNSHGYSDAVGAMYSTPKDLMKFARQIGKSNVLKPETWSLALDPYLKDGPNGFKWGFGFNIYQGKKVKVINHNGRTDGFRGGYYQFLEDDLTMIILGNNSDAERGAIINAFQAIMSDEDYYQPKTYESISIDASKLDDYIGAYKTEDFPFKILKFQDDLYVKSHGDAPSKLIPFDLDSFYCKYFDLLIRFKRENEVVISSDWIYKNESVGAMKTD